jgi:creatinine amidohydrolase
MRSLAAHLPWPRLEALAREGALALLPIGSTEAHGPHLPLNVDVVIAEEVCRRVAERRPEATVVFPAVCYALTDFAAPFAGTVTLAAQTAQALLEGVVEGICRSGFTRVVLVNHHLEPAHFAVVHAAAKAVRARLGTTGVLVPDHRKKPWGPQLGEEFMHGGSHAGCYETSLMLAAAPHLVLEAERRALPALDIDLPGAIKAGAKNFLDAGGPQAYFGAPAAATAEEGERLFALLTHVVEEALASHATTAPAHR